MIGRRVDTVTDLELAGDYTGPHVGYTGDLPSVFFILPNGRDPNTPPGGRSVHHVAIPPHRIRECSDGSLEIRESIGAEPFWHGYLDEGHVWRGVGQWA